MRALLAVLLVLSGCATHTGPLGAADLRLDDARPEETGLRVFDRGRTDDALPLLPWYSVDRQPFLERSFLPLAAETLRASGRFSALTTSADETQPRFAAQRVLTLRLHRTVDYSTHTTYMLGFHGFLLYLVGMPRGWTRTVVRVELGIGPPGELPTQWSSGSCSRTTWWWIYEDHDRHVGGKARVESALNEALREALLGLGE